MPAVVSTTTGNCVIVIRYSNMNMKQIYEYHMLPCLRQHGEYNSGERNGKESMQIIHNWSQAHFFKMGNKRMDAKSLINCMLFPYPLLAYVKLAENKGDEKLMLTHNFFKAANLARICAVSSLKLTW